jgi:hypothetical protein
MINFPRNLVLTPRDGEPRTGADGPATGVVARCGGDERRPSPVPSGGGRTGMAGTDSLAQVAGVGQVADVGPVVLAGWGGWSLGPGHGWW